MELKFYGHLPGLSPHLIPAAHAARGEPTGRGVKQKLTSVQERSDEKGAHAAGGQQVHPDESLRSNVGAVGFWGLTEPLG